MPVAARLDQGQTTDYRLPARAYAPVFTEKAVRESNQMGRI